MRGSVLMLADERRYLKCSPAPALGACSPDIDAMASPKRPAPKGRVGAGAPLIHEGAAARLARPAPDLHAQRHGLLWSVRSAAQTSGGTMFSSLALGGRHAQGIQHFEPSTLGR